MFFRKMKELQSLVNASRKSLKKANEKIENRNILIADMKRENTALYEENKELRFENEEQRDVLTRIAKLVNANKYNNEKAVLDKVKELARDYQSIN